ncbi:hypothetical protein OHC33_002337 [Knufia fluminis]|uniref:Uncharacterized protein n=1 Tax=Knufia fluminis TaxID=191047 RepID=A0AAN8F551_9EURO|nr:hypothetical protein OHC33_002337 [Knufia fluminis]
MGRWGYTMFQGDSDLDIVSEFDDEVGVSIHEKPEKLKEAREKLDAGLGAELMKKCREKEKGYHELMFEDPRYHTIILGAYMMQVGAKIAPDDRAHLAEIFPKIPSRAGYAMPMGDDGFRDPGKAQFKAALELYVDGQPRNFFDARLVSKLAQSLDCVDNKAAATIAARPTPISILPNLRPARDALRVASPASIATKSARRRTGRATSRSASP